MIEIYASVTYDAQLNKQHVTVTTTQTHSLKQKSAASFAAACLFTSSIRDAMNRYADSLFTYIRMYTNGGDISNENSLVNNAFDIENIAVCKYTLRNTSNDFFIC